MQTAIPTIKVTREDLATAVDVLARSEKGRQAMSALSAWLDMGGVSLDSLGQHAVFVLLQGTWGPFAGSAREAMRDALEDC